MPFLCRVKFAVMPILCRKETWSFCSSSKGPNVIFLNDPDHAGPQITSVSKQTRIPSTAFPCSSFNNLKLTWIDYIQLLP